MKVLKLTTLLLGVAIFTGVGATTLSAEGMKCGAGKCGGSMNMKALKNCDDKKCGSDEKCNCDKDGKECKCEPKKASKKAMKCGSN